MKYGYARVSSLGQDLDTQIQMLKNENCDEIFSEKITSNINKKIKRNELDKLIDKLKTGDTLVVTKLDRLARSTQQALTLIQELFEREVNIHILNIGRIENTPTGRLIFTVFSAFAESNLALTSLGHDPFLGLIVGVLDVLSGSMTTIDRKGNIVRQMMPGYEDRVEEHISKAIIKVINHFKSDMNTSMGLPAPFNEYI